MDWERVYGEGMRRLRAFGEGTRRYRAFGEGTCVPSPTFPSGEARLRARLVGGDRFTRETGVASGWKERLFLCVVRGFTGV